MRWIILIFASGSLLSTQCHSRDHIHVGRSSVGRALVSSMNVGGSVPHRENFLSKNENCFDKRIE